MTNQIRKGDIVSFFDSLDSWIVIGFKYIAVLRQKERMVKIERIIPKPKVDGLAHYSDLRIR